MIDTFFTIDKGVPAVVALGMFDGVHMGHRALLASCAEMAKELNATPVAHSFTEHPRVFFGQDLGLLTENGERAAIIASLGVVPQLCPFDKATASLEPEAYIRSIAARYDLRGVVAGENHRFGAGAKGDSSLLRHMAEELGFAIRLLQPVFYQGEPVSSSRIRSALLAGDIETANAMLGMPYFFRGTIAPNKRIGTRIGFPTINLDPGRKIVPKYGVYAAEVRFGVELDSEGAALLGVCNVGHRPTVEQEAKANVETHVLSEVGERYGQMATVSLRRMIREERRFETLEALRDQITRDREEAKRFFSQGVGGNESGEGGVSRAGRPREPAE